MGIGETSEIILVDENNKLVGSMIDKDRLDKKYLINRASVAVISDDEGNILLQRRSEHKYVYPLYWDNAAGGIIKKDQTDNECIIEELSEELGINIKIEELNDKGTVFVEHIVKEFIHVYSYTTERFEAKTNWEVKETSWKTPDEIEQIIKEGNISPVCVAAIKKARE